MLLGQYQIYYMFLYKLHLIPRYAHWMDNDDNDAGGDGELGEMNENEVGGWHHAPAVAMATLIFSTHPLPRLCIPITMPPHTVPNMLDFDRSSPIIMIIIIVPSLLIIITAIIIYAPFATIADFNENAINNFKLTDQNGDDDKNNHHDFISKPKCWIFIAPFASILPYFI